MTTEMIDIKKIDPNPWNPNEMDESTFDHLKREYDRIGMLQPILVRKKGDRFEVIDGEHRWKAARQMKLKKIEAVVAEMSDEDARATTINMGRIHGTHNPYKLAMLIKDMETIPELDQLLNMSPAELESLSYLLDMPEVVIPEEIKVTPTFGSRVTCPECGHEFEV